MIVEVSCPDCKKTICREDIPPKIIEGGLVVPADCPCCGGKPLEVKVYSGREQRRLKKFLN